MCGVHEPHPPTTNGNPYINMHTVVDNSSYLPAHPQAVLSKMADPDKAGLTTQVEALKLSPS